MKMLVNIQFKAYHRVYSQNCYCQGIQNNNVATPFYWIHDTMSQY